MTAVTSTDQSTRAGRQWAIRLLVWPLTAWIAYVFLWYLQYKFTGHPGSTYLFTVLTDWLGFHGYEKVMRIGTGSAELIAAIVAVRAALAGVRCSHGTRHHERRDILPSGVAAWSRSLRRRRHIIQGSVRNLGRGGRHSRTAMARYGGTRNLGAAAHRTLTRKHGRPGLCYGSACPIKRAQRANP